MPKARKNMVGLPKLGFATEADWAEHFFQRNPETCFFLVLSKLTQLVWQATQQNLHPLT
jgi:hypothetical protein